jgi:hypothetical protein
VQKTLNQYSFGAPIENLERGTVRGQTVYQATFPRNGQNVVLQIAENGALIRDNVNSQYLATIGMRPKSPALSTTLPVAIPDWHTAPVRQPLAEAAPVSFSSLPQAARDALLSFAGGGAIGTVQQGMLNGRTVYDAEVFPNGQSIDLRIAPSGSLVNDQVNDRFLAQYTREQTGADIGRAPGVQSSTSSGSSSGLPPLNNQVSESFDQLPLAVQTTVNAQASGTPIQRVIRGTFDGRPAYDVTFSRAGHWVNLRVADDGSILSSQTTQ